LFKVQKRGCSRFKKGVVQGSKFKVPKAHDDKNDFRTFYVQAWRRIGLLKNHESMSRSKYVECITRAANAIAREGLLPARMVNYYASKAKRAPIGQPVR